MIAQERMRLSSAVDALGVGATTVIITEEGDGWTAKDVLAHLIHYMEQIAMGLGVEGLRPPKYVTDNAAARLSGEEWNALATQASRDVPLETVRARFDMLADAIVERVRLRSDDDMNAVGLIPWSRRPLGECVAGDTVAHCLPHRAEIERAADRTG